MRKIRRRRGCEQLEARQLLAADLAGAAMAETESLADVELCTPDQDLAAAAVAQARPALAAEPAPTLRVLSRQTFVPNVPFLVRAQVEVGSQVDRSLWEDTANLSVTSGGASIDESEVELINGLGSALVTTTSTEPFMLAVTWNSQTIEIAMQPLDPASAQDVSGTLSDASGTTTWEGLINVTGDVVVPENQTLVISPGTVVLIDGLEQTPREQLAPGIRVEGSLQSNGTESDPVTITASNADQAWGELHADGGDVELNYTSLTRAGNSDRGGHTNTGPALRITSDGNLSLNTSNVANISGKIAQASSGQLNVVDSLLTRAVMGPEINNTGLNFQSSWLLDMAGRFHHNGTVDDNDGLYLHSQRNGQTIEVRESVVAGVQDDAIDTLGSDVLLYDSIVRDATDKAISVFNGETTVVRSLLVNADIGIETKGSGTSTPVTNVIQSTIANVDRAIRARDKDNPDPNVLITYNISNSILHVRNNGDAIYTDYDPTDLHVNYTWANEAWDHAGSNVNGGNVTSNPQFVDVENNVYLLPEGSPAIDAGDPASESDSDGTIADLGYRPRLQTVLGERGDFNVDGVIDGLDVDELCNAVQLGNQASRFDMNDDNAIDSQDMRVLIQDLLQTTRGDANLDGQFDSRDLVAVFQIGLYEDGIAKNAGWATGDWNCDGDFTSADMVVAFQDGGYVG